jgi:hypothetical protein
LASHVTNLIFPFFPLSLLSLLSPFLSISCCCYTQFPWSESRRFGGWGDGGSGGSISIRDDNESALRSQNYTSLQQLASIMVDMRDANGVRRFWHYRNVWFSELWARGDTEHCDSGMAGTWGIGYGEYLRVGWGLDMGLDAGIG